MPLLIYQRLGPDKQIPHACSRQGRYRKLVRTSYSLVPIPSACQKPMKNVNDCAEYLDHIHSQSSFRIDQLNHSTRLIGRILFCVLATKFACKALILTRLIAAAT